MLQSAHHSQKMRHYKAALILMGGKGLSLLGGVYCRQGTKIELLRTPDEKKKIHL